MSDRQPALNADYVRTRVVPVDLLCRTIALFNRCDWADVCGEVSGLIEEIAQIIEASPGPGHSEVER